MRGQDHSALRSRSAIATRLNDTIRSRRVLPHTEQATFQNGVTLNYASGQALRDGAGDYFYEDGAELRTGDEIYHPAGGVMVDDEGAVYNENGDLSFAPYTRQTP